MNLSPIKTPNTSHPPNRAPIVSLDAVEEILVLIVEKLIKALSSSAAVYNLKIEIDNNNHNRRTAPACPVPTAHPPSISKEQRTRIKECFSLGIGWMGGSFPEKMCRVNAGQ